MALQFCFGDIEWHFLTFNPMVMNVFFFLEEREKKEQIVRISRSQDRSVLSVCGKADVFKERYPFFSFFIIQQTFNLLQKKHFN
jgi:hypothetical protein